MSVKVRWLFVALMAGAILGAGAVLYFIYRPASSTIDKLLADAETVSRQHGEKIAEFGREVGEITVRAESLERLLREERETRRRIEERARRTENRAARAESRADELESIIRRGGEAGGRAIELSIEIAEENRLALDELRHYRETLEISSGNSAERNPPAED